MNWDTFLLTGILNLIGLILSDDYLIEKQKSNIGNKIVATTRLHFFYIRTNKIPLAYMLEPFLRNFYFKTWCIENP